MVCGCRALLTAPENTILCHAARVIHYKQGIDPAPAYCHPLPEDEETRYDDRPEFSNVIFGHCDKCRPAAIEQLSEEIQDAVTEREEVKAKEHLLDPGVYNQNTLKELNKLLESIHGVYHSAMEVAHGIEQDLLEDPELLQRVPDEELRNHLLQPGMDKYVELFTRALERCMHWLECLHMQMQQHFPERMFVDLYHLVVK
ncbi:hypothetical protein CC86DRAFT_410979 [Ophiobolus disseminans]|uniref:Uncharacterized protein n=1 Tax=Ophiobolus disseminans TaxID=1469910 RepID=A0A6A6ZLX0_9PLEO|nr:hypothetical protein CC86DRAFT_410979 [Ophiobolus disseminans]